MAIGITGILITAICAFTVFSGKSFAALFNYCDLDSANRIAMDQLSRDVRQANRVTAFSTNSLSLEDSDLGTLTYSYNPNTRLLTRSKGGITTTILNECDTLRFDVCQRNPVGGSYDVYPAASVATAKVIDVSWSCSRTIFGHKQNTESVQTARIVIRKQGT